jgi:hypothetical protein
VHAIVPAAELRPRLIAAVERGMARTGTADGTADRPPALAGRPLEET